MALPPIHSRKMDVRRLVRFACCVKFLYGLANNTWENKEIPWKDMGLPQPSAERRMAFYGMARYAELIDIVFVDFLMSYEFATREKLVAAEEAFQEFLECHLQFNPDFTRDVCDGAIVSRYQIEAIAGLLRTFRNLLKMADEVNAETVEGGPQLRFRPGRLCNSYLEGRFSIFRCAAGNSVLDGAMISFAWVTMMAREFRGDTKIAIDRKDYSGLFKLSAAKHAAKKKKVEEEKEAEEEKEEEEEK
ncbi:MAG TPA: hypothetical protein EYN67_09545 [Flavobacteriales bacterium]|nr:hypothetical protein [Flavobacteriales bacterium]